MAEFDTARIIVVYEDESVKQNQPLYTTPIFDFSSDCYTVDESLFPKTMSSFTYSWGKRSYGSAFVFQRQAGLANPPMTKANVLLWVEKAKDIYDTLGNLGRIGAETEIIQRAIVKKLTTSVGQPVKSFQDVLTSLIGRKMKVCFKNSREEYFEIFYYVIRQVFIGNDLHSWARHVADLFLHEHKLT